MNNKNKFIIIIFLIFIILFLTQLNFSQAINSKEEKVTTEILEKFEKGEEKIRVIVNLNDKIIEKKFFGLMSSEKKVDRKDLIKETKIQEKVKHNFIYSNSFSAELTQKEINILIEKDEIQGIYIEPIFKTFLQDSVNIINASSTWPIQIESINLTGKDQTICIIDTGVNYNHPDLGNGCYGNNDPSSNCKVIGGWDFCADNTNCNTEDSDPLDESDSGHGTHVTGIAAAKGTINGVAPDAKIIMIKAANSSGSFNSTKLDDAIHWCINNATKFNISIISMSLGSLELYNNYCNPPEAVWLTNAINAAINQNISVIVATGNDENLTHIAYPACIQKTIKVGSTTKNPESISYFSNRWALDMINAPGTSINSTLINGGYGTKQGTSMATPHIAGAVAIINQYFKSQGITKTPTEINNILINTGKIIYDSLSERNYTRIDLFSAIDETSPQIEFTVPTEENNTFFKRNWIFVNTSLTEDNFKNITFNLYNQTSKINSTNYNEKILSINWTNLEDGIYYYNVTAYDNANNLNFTQTRKITIDNTAPIIELIFPENQKITNNFEINFIGNFSDLNLKNSTLYIWNSTNESINQTTKEITGQENQTNILVNLTNTSYNTYFWNYYTCDNLNNCAFNVNNNTLIISEINIVLISPEDNNYTRLEDITFICNSTSYGTNLKNITFNIWNKTTNTSINETTINLEGLELNESQQIFNNKLLNDGEYLWGCITYNEGGYFNSKNYSISRYNTAPNLQISSNEVTQNSVIIKLNSTREINYTLEGSGNSITNSTFRKNHSIIISGLTPSTTYYFNTTYCDILNNCNKIENNNFTTLEESSEPEDNPPSSGGSSGSSTSTTSTPILSEPKINYGTIENPINSTQLIKGYTTTIKENISVYFQNSLNQKHLIRLNQKNNLSVIFTIQSEPILVEIKLNETKFISLNSPYFYDLQIKLIQINPEIKIDIKEIYFPTNYIETPNTNNSVYLEDLKNNEEEKQETLKVIIFSTITIIFLIIIILLIKSLISKNEE